MCLSVLVAELIEVWLWLLLYIIASTFYWFHHTVLVVALSAIVKLSLTFIFGTSLLRSSLQPRRATFVTLAWTGFASRAGLSHGRPNNGPSSNSTYSPTRAIVAKIATTLLALTTPELIPTTPLITAPTATTTNTHTAYSRSPLSAYAVQTRSQRTHTHPAMVGYQLYRTLYLRDTSPLPHRSQSSILYLLLPQCTFLSLIRSTAKFCTFLGNA